MSKKVVITIGDPAGCGPYITLKAIENFRRKDIRFIIVGGKKIIEKIPSFSKIKKRIEVVDVNTSSRIKKGYISKEAGKASLNYLKEALFLIKKEKLKAFVTAPVSKEAIKLIEPQFSGHTEFLADFFKVKNFAMMMVGKIKVVPFTRHIPLRDVSKNISKESLVNLINLVYESLKEKFGIKRPKVALASINPHAGVNTFLDKEEKIMVSAIKECKNAEGPYPADSLFSLKNLKKFDCIICGYHDQAMIPFKIFSFKKGVNLTLGLPIIRTSPAHGVAFEAIRRGQSLFFTSMLEAIKLAVKLAFR